MVNGPGNLSGLRVLVVEDNLLLAEVISDVLESYGCSVVGPIPDLEAGLALVREVDLDGAVLDINLRGESCFPIAAELAARGVPYLFLTGYDNSRIVPPEHRGAERLSKPVDPAGLSAAIAELFRSPSIN